ncbi:cation:proton antiporter [Comamonas sp. NLF-1-9]|uniref:cation:proton antiporter domain-containing protein n=1 Tax=Comamonas sp. NLF-1-9 TaxID=2853163 RepID=UPI001C47C370|nr:cation:proton antiporter [Comamonas sp. NLF-1-9]QXL83684.1 cation:proton antiporter [Comamonas sp. NLF-1-9]
MDGWRQWWAQWLPAATELATVQWALLLALAAAAGYLVQRRIGLPKMVGYALVGSLAGLLGFDGSAWPLQGTGLFVVELAVAVVLFECGGRLPLRWLRHNPMVLVQSLAESALTWVAVYALMLWLKVPEQAVGPLALVAVAASPTVLMRVVTDSRAAGAVTERAIVLSTLSTLYVLGLGAAQAQWLGRPGASAGAVAEAVLTVLGASVLIGALLALALRAALRVMSPLSENTAIVVLALIAATTALAPRAGGSAPLAALLAGMLLKHFYPRPWAWPRQASSASTMLAIVMFVLVSTVAAQTPWNLAVAASVLALVIARLVAKALGVGLGNAGSGASWRQALWTSAAMAPMSGVALLVVTGFASAAPETGALVAQVALPAILLMELLGAVIATFALYGAGESIRPLAHQMRARAAEQVKEQP